MSERNVFSFENSLKGNMSESSYVALRTALMEICQKVVCLTLRTALMEICQKVVCLALRTALKEIFQFDSIRAELYLYFVNLFSK